MADLTTQDLGMLLEACHHSIELLGEKLEESTYGGFYTDEDIASIKREIQQYELLSKHVGRLWLASKGDL
jgi:hypothetical protein